MPWLINAAQLEKFRKNQKNLLILDASYHIDGRNAYAEYLDKHIIDAQFFDIAYFDDPSTPHLHKLRQDTAFISDALGKMGVRNDYKIIFYDNSALHSAARALWMFKMFGHNPHLLYILDGGLAAYEQHGGKFISQAHHVTPKTYNAKFQPQYLATLQDIKIAVKETTQQIIDLRHPVRFTGGKESRPQVRSGHIPGSIGLPYMTLFDKEGSFLPLAKIRKKTSDLNIAVNAPVITTCGSGITAAIFNFILDLMSHTAHKLYDGSWSEYGSEILYPGEMSLAERPVESFLDC